MEITIDELCSRNTELSALLQAELARCQEILSLPAKAREEAADDATTPSDVRRWKELMIAYQRAVAGLDEVIESARSCGVDMISLETPSDRSGKPGELLRAVALLVQAKEKLVEVQSNAPAPQAEPLPPRAAAAEEDQRNQLPCEVNI